MNDHPQPASWWPKTLFGLALVCLALIPIAPLGVKFGLMPFRIGLLALALAGLVGAFITIAGLITFARKRKSANHAATAAMSFRAVVIALIPVVVTAPQLLAGLAHPPIHDISTDLVDPPTFNAAAIVSSERENSLDHEGEAVAAQQRAAYPDVTAITVATSTERAFQRALDTVLILGWEIVSSDPTNKLEAIATTKWFGFKDDIAIRVQAANGGAKIDLRSVSRVGMSDLGANARRIMEFKSAFAEQLPD